MYIELHTSDYFLLLIPFEFWHFSHFSTDTKLEILETPEGPDPISSVTEMMLLEAVTREQRHPETREHQVPEAPSKTNRGTGT